MRVWEKDKKYGGRLTHQVGADRYKSKVPDPARPGWDISDNFPASGWMEARKLHEQRLVRVRSGEEAEPSKMNWDELMDDFAEGFEGLIANNERAPGTLERYRSQYKTHVKEKYGSKSVQKTAKGIGSRLLADWRKDPNLSDVASLYAFLSVLCNHAVEKGILLESPLKRVPKRERPKRRVKNPPRCVTDDECSALIAHTPESELFPNRNRALMALLAYTAPRVMEGLGPKWADFDLQGGVWHLSKQLARKKRGEPVKRVPLKTARRKGGDRRDVDLIPDLVKLQKQHKADAFAHSYAGSDDFVYCTSVGTPLTYKNFLDRVFNPAAAAAGLNPKGTPRLTPHDLRHSAISRWIAAGIDPVTIASQAGDDVATILSTYAHEFDKAKRADTIRTQIAAGTSIRLA